MTTPQSESAKVQQHLDLLREQYVKLQHRHSELEQKYSHALSTTGNVGPDHFVSKLLKLTADLYDKSLYSDITVILKNRRICGHRFVLAARSRRWDRDESLASTSELDLSHMSSYVAGSMLRWVYTDSIVLPSEQGAIIELLSASNNYHLLQLKEKCEQAIISSVTLRNCIKLYQTSEENAAQILKEYCLKIISIQWDNLNTSDFEDLSGSLLYDMFKAHTSFPLHLAIQHLREDVVFLFLIEHNTQLPQKLNECNDEGDIPLNLALLNRHEAIANTLVSHKCDLDIQDQEGNSLLHLAILRGDSFAASFLIRNGASTILSCRDSQETPIHMVATYNPSQALTNVSSVCVNEAPWPSESMAQIASLLLEYHANPDAQDMAGYTPLQRAIEYKNEEVFTILLTNPVLNLDLRNNVGASALWLALQQLDSTYLTSEDTTEHGHTFAARLIERGSSADAIDTRTGNSLLHRAALGCNEAAAIFLVHHRAVPNHKNVHGEAPIHLASKNGLHKLVEVLLQNGADPNLQTVLKPTKPLPLSFQVGSNVVSTNKLNKAPSSVLRESSSNGSTGMIGVDSLSPSTLGALNALNFTSQLTSGYSVVTPSTSGYSSATGLPAAVGMVAPSIKDSTSQKLCQKQQSLNPFGSDSEDEEVDQCSAMVSGYHVTPLQPHPANLQWSGEKVQVPAVKARRSSSLLDQQRDRNTSSVPPSPALSHASGSDVVEFIEPPEKFDISVDPGIRTALHLAIVHTHPQVVDMLLSHKGTSHSGKLEIGLNVNLRDGYKDSPLSLALWTDQFDIAKQLLAAGADHQAVDTEEPGLLYVAILREKPQAALFLLENGANYKQRTPRNESLLLLAIRHKLVTVVDKLCEMLGSDISSLSAADNGGNTSLWVALRSRQVPIASKLVIHGSDPNAWYRGLDGCTLSLLHRAILLNDTPTSCFLIRSGADVNSYTRPSGQAARDTLPVTNGEPSDGEYNEEFSSPLHMACERGLKSVVQCLVEHHANINTKDHEGQTALHVSITCKQPQCSDILLSQPDLDLAIRDRSGRTPFAKAMTVKDNEAGLAILQREPSAAEQVDSRGQNFLHLAVINQDLEAVIFLLSVRVDINSKVQGPTLNTPLHYAVKASSEILTRHLLLAGARVSDIDNHHRGAIHMAVEGDIANILSILLEHGADPDIMDENGNSGLHLAMQLGNMACAKILLEESNINLLAINFKGENCLHMLSRFPRDNAAALFNMLLAVASGYPINKQDGDGNTALLLAYIGGSPLLCDALIKSGAHPGIVNKQGLSIFNSPVATKQLLFRILDQIHMEPTWLEGNSCFNCNMKFNISHRKHHCRHCGRLLCKLCTSHQIPILKFDLSKAVRVCEVCADSFCLAASR